MSNGNSIAGNWVAKRYEGERAKSVSLHIKEGIGYFELDSGPNYIIAAFRTVGIPEGASQIVETDRIMALERRFRTRQGGHDEPRKPKNSRPMPKAVNEVFFSNQRKDVY